MPVTEVLEYRSELTAAQQAFVDVYVKHGRTLTATQCALRAGYAPSSAKDVASRLLRDPRVAAEIYHATRTAYGSHGLLVAYDALVQIAMDKSQPAAARVRAAAELIRASGLLARHQAEAAIAVDRERQADVLADMSTGELRRMVDAADAHLQIARRVLDAGAIDVEYVETPAELDPEDVLEA